LTFKLRGASPEERRDAHIPDEPLLREKAREAIRSGKLPSRPADRIVERHGWSGLACPVCGEPVKRDEVDVEIQFRRQDPTLGLDAYQLHPRCFAAWEFERTKIPGAAS
jgi:hypothetical protein